MVLRNTGEVPKVVSDMPEIGSTHEIQDIAKLVSQRSARPLLFGLGTMQNRAPNYAKSHALL
ncbi:MAG: hypothetical protein CMO03_09075 [Thalassospira sp.]|uniref:Uncharacterized protein n=1 Tax=Thalassospira xiamenensis TaxID=220697 RepID=A0ABR5Y3F9_9PROT|nr:hypothetical protein AUP40_16300 [Thalassospira xiamenensis]MAB32264.1 hypothetical protein [Thalassospira sp.]OHZ03929.1 hypothetical protein BC440_03665 [Thalassospira sp. MIT1004]KZD10666.1 hypothetical protein AUP45_10535 [Thalassospira xiamenensis]MAL29674.1 hypothetical protein [Thalassospira sp.]